MLMGSGKSPLCHYIAKILEEIRMRTGDKMPWQVEDATFQKMSECHTTEVVF